VYGRVWTLARSCSIEHSKPSVPPTTRRHIFTPIIMLIQTIVLLCVAACMGVPTSTGPTATPTVSQNNSDFQISTEIVGGFFAQPGQFRFVASIRGGVGSYGAAGWQFCSGAMIAPNLMLTAAHCSAGIPIQQFNPYASDTRVFLGRTDIRKSTAEEGGFEYRVTRIFNHPNYCDDGVRCNHENDIAVWQLTLTNNPTRARANAIPTIGWNRISQSPFVNQVIVAAGWGATSEQGQVGSNVLKYTTIPIISRSSCSTMTREQISQNKLCALYNPSRQAPTDTCAGDSGSVIFAYSSGRPVAMGITSYGEGCARQGKPGVYTRVSIYSSWITGIVSRYATKIR
jgi:trypsin